MKPACAGFFIGDGPASPWNASRHEQRKHRRPPSARPGLLDGRALVLAGIVLSAFNLRTAVTSLTPLLDEPRPAVRVRRHHDRRARACCRPPRSRCSALPRRVSPTASAWNAPRCCRCCWPPPDCCCVRLAGGTGGLLVGSVVALAGMGIGNVVLPPLVKRYFADRVGTVSTLYITVLQLGTILPALVAVPTGGRGRLARLDGRVGLVRDRRGAAVDRRAGRRTPQGIAAGADATTAPSTPGDEAPELAEPRRRAATSGARRWAGAWR